MALGKRLLRVTFQMPSGNNVVLDERLDLHVNIHKDALAIQHKCTINVINLSSDLRTQLLTQFTAWNLRQKTTGQATSQQAPYVNVTVEAGYQNADGTGSQTTVIFKGQVTNTSPSSAPPNMGTQIECRSQQIDKTTYVTGLAPVQTTFKQYVQWAGQQMGVSSVICETSYDNQTITNPSASTYIVGNLLIDIQNSYRPAVAAFIDNDTLIVKDVTKLIESIGTVTLSEFIGMPVWDEWGATFKCLFTPLVRLAGGAIVQSKMNPGLASSSFVITSLDYSLTSRDTDFYVTAYGCPPS